MYRKIDKELSNKIYIFSFVMAMIVVIYHFNIDLIFGFEIKYYNGYDEMLSRFWKQYMDGLGGMSLGYFFLSSAFLFYYNLTEENLKIKLKKRCFSLLVPYMIWNLLAFLLEIWVNKKVPEYDSGMMVVEKVLINPYNGPLWFIIVLVIYLMISPIVFKLKKYPKLMCGTVVIIYIFSFAYCNFGLYKYFPIFPAWMERFVRYTPVYFTGALVGLLKPEWILKNPLKGKERYFAIAFFIGMFLNALNLSIYLSWVMNMVSPILIWFAIPKKKFRKSVKKCYKISFLLYTIHWLILRITQTIYFPMTSLMGIQISGAMSILSQIIAGIVIFGIVVLMDKIFRCIPQLHKVLTGNR